MDRDWLDKQRAWRRRAWRLGKILKRARKDPSAKPCRNALLACRCSCYDLLIWNMRLQVHRTRQRSSDATDPVFISVTVSASASAIRSTNAPLIRLLAQPSRSRPRPARPLALRGPHGVAFSMGRRPQACPRYLRCSLNATSMFQVYPPLPPWLRARYPGGDWMWTRLSSQGAGRGVEFFGFHPSHWKYLRVVSWMPIYS